MQYTSNLNLKKPEYSDNADIADINSNMDAIDTAVNNRKTKQTAKADPSASGTASAFISSISQNANGEITAQKKTVSVSNAGVTLAWGTSKTIGSVAGTNLTATLPSNPVTKSAVDSVLGAGSGTTKYYRQDGSWQVPYTSKSAASGGTDVSLCTTGEKYTWNNKVSCTKSNVDSALGVGSGNLTYFYKRNGTWDNPVSKSAVDSALGAGSGTTFYRKDGTWATPPNTTYESKAAASGGTAVSLCTTGEKYTWNSKVSCTEANVKSALSIGSGSTFLRKDGSWATPANTWRDYEVKAYHVESKFSLLSGETKSVAGNDLKDENNNTLATPSGYRAVGAVYFSPGHSSCTVDLVSVSSTGTDTVLRVRNPSSNGAASNVDPKITIFYIKTGSP